MGAYRNFWQMRQRAMKERRKQRKKEQQEAEAQSNNLASPPQAQAQAQAQAQSQAQSQRQHQRWAGKGKGASGKKKSEAKEDDDAELLESLQSLFQAEWLREHYLFLLHLENALAPGGVATVMIGDSGVKKPDLMDVDTLACTLALTKQSALPQELCLNLDLLGSATARSPGTAKRQKRTEHILLLQKRR